MAEILWLTKRRYMGKDLVAEKFGRYYELPRHLAALGHRVTVLALAYRNEPDVRRADGEELVFESIDVRRFPRYLYRAIEVIRRRRVDVVVGASDVHFCLLAYLLGRGFGRKVIFDLYDNYEYFAAGRVPPLRWLFYRWMARTDANVAFSQPLVELLTRKAPNGRYRVVAPSVDKAVFRPLDRQACRKRFDLPADEILIGYFGAVSESRGVSALFDAAEILRGQGLSCRLVLAGPADRDLKLELGKSAETIYLGLLEHSQIPYLISACDVNVICYKEDGLGQYNFPVKLPEYIACRVPFATPALGAMIDFLREYPEYLYEVGDAPGLARTISSLLSLQDHRFPEVHSWQESAADYSDYIARVCSPE